jgi:hypothetical protein
MRVVVVGGSGNLGTAVGCSTPPSPRACRTSCTRLPSARIRPARPIAGWPVDGVPSSTYSSQKAAVERILDRTEVGDPELAATADRARLARPRRLDSLAGHDPSDRRARLETHALRPGNRPRAVTGAGRGRGRRHSPAGPQRPVITSPGHPSLTTPWGGPSGGVAPRRSVSGRSTRRSRRFPWRGTGRRHRSAWR